MGFFEDMGNAIGGAANAVADAVETVVNGIGDAAADVVETIGNGLHDGANSIGNALSTLPGIGGFVRDAFDYIGNVIAGVANVISAVVKGIFAIVGGVLGGIIRIIGGLLSLNLGLIIAGFIDIFSGIAGALTVLLGQIVSLMHRILLLQTNDRPLTKDELSKLRVVFRDSLALYNIRVIEGRSGIYGAASNRPFTLGNTIYLKQTDLNTSFNVLVHESVHVWQYQNLGSRYAADALGAQAYYGGGRRAYNWTAEFARGNTTWLSFNKEAMAECMEDIWLEGVWREDNGTIHNGSGSYFEFDETATNPGLLNFTATKDNLDHTQFANESIATMRGWFNARISRLL